MRMRNKGDKPYVYGEVVANGGKLSRLSAEDIILSQSKIYFSGDFHDPRVDINGIAFVERNRIIISLKGTPDNPELKLSSEPVLPQEQLLIMIMTGKKWKGAEVFLGTGIIAPDLAIDFFDYFLLGGNGGKIARKFGIDDFSVKFDEATKGVEVKKVLSDKVGVGYGIEQTQTKIKKDPAIITQKLSGEYKVTDNISIGAEKELKQESKIEEPDEKQKTNDKVFIKFKKNF